MSFLAGGGECAVNNNPLAQLSKRAEVDTSLQASARNQSNITQQHHVLHSETTMNPHSQQMMNKFMDQNSNLLSNSFDFHPMSHEINNLMNDRNQLQNQFNPQLYHQQISQPVIQGTTQNISRSWASEFAATNPVLTESASSLQQNDFTQHQRNPLMHSNNLFRLQQTPLINSNIQLQRNLQNNVQQSNGQQFQTSVQNVDWEDTFKDLEEYATEVETNSKVEFEPLDELKINKSHMMSFNDKYHEEYQFEENNEFLHNPSAYEIGCKLMDGGAKLSEAALAFEAAVQEDPKHVDAWLKLGLVQTQNEKELKGITALENCLLIDKKNLTALMNLAISYVNEGYDNAAFKTFENWIETKYPEIVSKARSENPNDTSDDRYSLNKRITNLFLKAAQLSPSGVNIDADVQTGLGVLFYAMEEYDKTLDCFQAAIRCDPNNALSWNRLGASYANSNRPEQAIEAYSKALQLNPNFVRARYNLGVSFINMGMYKDAVDHLLTGLSMHEVESPDGNNTLVSDTVQSSSLIETLKRAFLAMDRRDLIDKVRPGMNVSQFRKEFNV